MKLPRTMRIGGVDPVDLYLVACNSHDGTSAFRLLVSPVRVVCANTQAAAIRGAKSSFSIRHTSGAKGQIAQARAGPRADVGVCGGVRAEAERMIAATITDRRVHRASSARLWPVDEDSKRSKTIGENRRYELVRLLRHSPTNEDIRGTRWAAYQAITEYADHVAPVADKRQSGRGPRRTGGHLQQRRAGQDPRVRPARRLIRWWGRGSAAPGPTAPPHPHTT